MDWLRLLQKSAEAAGKLKLMFQNQARNILKAYAAMLFERSKSKIN